MSLEAVQKVTETEEKVRALKAQAAEEAKRLVQSAEKAGKERLSAARAEAEAQAKSMLSEAEQRAAKHAEAVLEETRRSCDSLRRGAEGNLEDAAALVIRRVVNV